MIWYGIYPITKHYLEQVEGHFKSSEEMQKFRNTYRNPGIMGYYSPHMTLTPPSNIPTSHDKDVRRVVSGLDDEVAYGFRQVNCDSFAFQKREVAGVRMNDLVPQYLTFVELKKKELEQEMRECGSWVGFIPEIARFTAGAWTMSLIARELLHDEKLAERAEGLVGVRVTKRLDKGIKGKVPGSFDEMLDRNFGDGGQYYAALVIAQAYKEHFISSMGIRELFKKERMEPHLERLDPERTPDPMTRANELILLAWMKDERFADAIVQRLGDENEDIAVRKAAVEAAKEMHIEMAVPAVINLIRRIPEEWEDDLGDVEIKLGYISTPTTVPILAKALRDDPDKKVRMGMVCTLEGVGGEEAENALIQAMKDDPSEDVRGYAAETLGRLGCRRAVPLLIREIRPDSSMRGCAAWAIGKMARDRSVLDLSAAVEPLKRTLQAEKNQKRKEILVWALGEIGNDEGIRATIRTLEESPEAEVRSSAVSGLGKPGNDIAIPALVKALRDKSAKVRVCAVYALERIGNKEVAPELVRLMNEDPDKEVRESASRVILSDFTFQKRLDDWAKAAVGKKNK